jgi:hypothetical protein
MQNDHPHSHPSRYGLTERDYRAEDEALKRRIQERLRQDAALYRRLADLDDDARRRYGS